ncbi:MAG: glycosidase [Chloroflexota bacterium]|nr:MAG: glycosidase [Chloroflexota bacterium]
MRSRAAGPRYTRSHMDGTELFSRCPANPILTARDLPYAANTVMNPGAALVDGETVLLMRVEDRRGISHLTVARSSNGIDGWRIDPKPSFRPAPERHAEELWGVEDPRLTWLPELGQWLVVYTAYSRRGPLVALATTSDFRHFERIGPALPPEDKDAALFGRRIDGCWAMLHRPTPVRGNASIWVSYSPDLRHWGGLSLVLEAREGAWWDADKVGLGPPPLETPEGWLIMYHGVHVTASGSLYRAGLALLDLEDPRVLRHRTDEWVMSPTEPYERMGDVGGVVFPTGWIHDETSDELRLYYGAADTSIGLATAHLADVLTYLRSCPSPDRPTQAEAR